MIRFLLLHRIDYTDAHPAFGAIGAAVTIIVGLMLEQRL